ncbi:hypothetical protein F4824DRAFT_113873 [Ustulina deusta]|nr:hypothetical protein F4824DRAFT_113873 [Ustulina deusta]
MAPWWERHPGRKKRGKVLSQQPADPPAVPSNLAIDQVSSDNLLEEWKNIRRKDEWVQQALALNASQGEAFAYSHILAELFKAEAAQSGGPSKRIALNQLRQKAALVAACQRLAFAIGAPVLGRLSPFTNSVRPPYNASVNPGFWIKNQTETTRPRFLWDTDQKRTVETSEFKSCPEFVFISHTWGNDINTFSDWVEVPGVPWKIPQINKFKIEELPSKLAKTRWGYAWIDLFTVPQGPVDEEGLEIQANEIRHQPTFLRQAKCAIAWFSDISKWSLMPDVMQFLGLEIFESTAALRPDDKDKIKRAKGNILDNLVETPELVDYAGDMGEPGDGIYANGWFRSPWTLQECCVRPDMLLADANFDFLSATTGYPVAINDIAAVLVAVNSLPSMGNVRSLPRAAMLALTVFQNAGLDHLVCVKSLVVTVGDKGHHKLELRERITEGENWFFDQTLNANKALKLIERGGISRVKEISSNHHESRYPV